MTYNLVEIQKRQESTDKFVQKVGKTLWHYTSFPALDGILRKKKIWFGSATNVNDAKEVIGFIDNLKQNIENGLTQNNIKPKCDVDKIFKEIYDRTSQKHLFMFCLSQALDDAAQWDRYADHGRGVAIEFNTEALHNLLYYHGMIIGEQYYTQETRDHELYKLLSSYISTGIFIFSERSSPLFLHAFSKQADCLHRYAPRPFLRPVVSITSSSSGVRMTRSISFLLFIS